MEKIRKKRKIKSNTSVLLSPSPPKVNRVNKKHPPFSIWFVLASIMIGFYTVGFTNFLKTKSATTVWDFGTAVEYTYNAAFVEFVGGVARLIQIDQTDNDNDATAGFGAGTHSSTQWDASNLWLELDAAGLSGGAGNFTSRIFDAGTSTAQWVTSTLIHQRPYGKELPNSLGVETAYTAGNADMTNNVLLFHLNETGSNSLEGGTITDNSGNSNTGTLATGSDGLDKSSSTAMFVSSTSFDGGDDQISVADANSLDMGISFSISAWVKSLNVTSTPGLLNTTNRHIVSKQAGTTGYQLGVDIQNKPYFGFEDIGVNNIYKYDNSVPNNSNTTGTNGRIPLGSSGGDISYTFSPSIIKDGSTYKMWYTGSNGNYRIYYATSPDGFTWTKYDNSVPVNSDTSSTNGRVPIGTNGKGDDLHVGYPTVIKDGSTYKMWYSGYDGATWRIYYATSPDGLTWTKYDNSIPANSDTTSTNGRVPLGSSGGDVIHAYGSSIIKDNSTYKMWYSGVSADNIYRSYYATSPDGLIWTKYDNSVPANSNTTGTNGRIPLGSSGGDSVYVVYPGVIKDGSVYKMWYSGYDTTWRAYYATSPDGLTWTKYDNSVPANSDTTSTNGRIPLGSNGRGDDVQSVTGPSIIKDGSTYKIWYAGYDGSIYRIYYTTLETGATSTSALSTGWNHLTGVVDGTSVKLYVNGSLDSSITTAVTGVSNTGNLLIGTKFEGALDELAVFNRVLSATEIADIYKRGALKLKYQVRTCDDDVCSGESFVGPNGTNSDYYDESDTNVTTTPAFTLSNLFANRYFQYKAYFETASSTLSPELKSVTATPNHYYGGDATIINSATAPAYSTINSFTETLGGSNAGTIRYQLSPDNVYWHYWNDTTWASSTDGFDTANTSTAINANISTFATQIGTGNLYYKAFLRSVSSTQQVELDNISIITNTEIYFTSSSFSGTEADGTISISINLSQALLANATVNYTVSTTATSTALGADVDYTLANGTATILAGQTTTTFNIILNNDTLDEDTETIVIDLSSPTNSILGTTSTLTYIITDNDDAPTIAFTSATGSGLESITPANIEVLLSVTSSKNITVDYVVTGTATGSGTDYTLANGTATITAGSVTTTIAATIVNDILDEVDETVILTISNPTNSSLGVNNVHTYTITDNDDAPTIAFTSATGSGLESITPANIEVLLSATSSKNITVDYVVTGTATGSGTDYTLANGTATITAGSVTTTISAIIVDDTTDDNDETIILTISNPTNSSLGANTTHTYTITDNDDAPVTITPAPAQGGSGFSATQTSPPTVVPITDTNIPETIPSTLGIIINNNETHTNSTQVYLGLNGGNAKRMAISNTSDFQNIGQENYTQTKTWNLCFGKTYCQEGTYTVYVKFYSEFGISSNTLTDTIIYTSPITILTPPTIIIPPEFEKLPLKAEPIIPKAEIKQTPALIPEKPTEIIPPPTEQEIRETKPELVKELEQTPTPLVLKEIKWDLIPFEPIRELLNIPFTGELANLVNKFPTLGQTFEQTGIKTMSDLNRLENVQLVLPNLSEVTQFRTNDNIGTQLGEVTDLKTNILPKAGTLASLSSKEKDKIPTEVVFANSANGAINISARMTIDEKTKKPIQTITAVSGKKLELVVKPEHKVEKIKGYLVVKKIKKDETSLLHLFFSAVVEPVSAKEIQTEFVLLEFEYTDPDNDGIYTADIQMPVVEGEYEIITVMDYEDITLGNKEIRLVTVVDPEGYVYEKIGDKEAMIKDATISIFYLNKETQQYELWPAEKFNQQNPQKTDRRGKYSFLVPEGSYYLRIEADNYKTYAGAPFMVQEGSDVHENIEMKVKNPWLRMLDWKLGLIAVLFLIVSFMTYVMYSNIKSRSQLLKKMDEMEKSINNNKINNTKIN